MKRPRLALVTSLWPLPDAPHSGKPIYETALRLLNWAEVEVFCLTPRYPPIGWLQPISYAYHAADSGYAPAGISSRYLRYWTVPLVGRAWNGLGSERVLAPVLRAWRPDVVLSYWLYPTSWASVRIARKLQVPVIVGSRGSDLNRIPGALERRLTASTLKRADAVVTVTAELRRLAIELGADPARSHSIPNGCDTSLYRPVPAAEARAALGLPAAGQLVLQVGNLLTAKGVFDLLEAFSHLATEWPDLRLALVGEGPAREQLHFQAAARGLAGRLLLPGPRPSSQVPLWMNAADVVCLASHAEGCPNVVVEALACARPIVGCDVGGIAELLRDGAGLLVAPHQPVALAKALAEALRRDWGQNRVAGHSGRSWEDVARETFAVCQAAMERWRPS